jgi:hypothetical protein
MYVDNTKGTLRQFNNTINALLPQTVLQIFYIVGCDILLNTQRIVVYPWQLWLCEHATALRYTYTLRILLNVQ